MPPFIRNRRGWDWFSPREIRHLPCEQRTQLVRDAMAAAQRHWTFRAIPVCGLMVGITSMCTLNLRHFLHPTFLLATQLLGFITFLSLGIGTLWHQRRIYRRSLREAVESQGIAPAACFDCGYDVEGFTGAECPVCGTVLVPHPVPPHLASGASDGPGPID